MSTIAQAFSAEVHIDHISRCKNTVMWPSKRKKKEKKEEEEEEVAGHRRRLGLHHLVYLDAIDFPRNKR
jgi:hypothetical protein